MKFPKVHIASERSKGNKIKCGLHHWIASNWEKRERAASCASAAERKKGETAAAFREKGRVKELVRATLGWKKGRATAGKGRDSNSRKSWKEKCKTAKKWSNPNTASSMQNQCFPVAVGAQLAISKGKAVRPNQTKPKKPYCVEMNPASAKNDSRRANPNLNGLKRKWKPKA